jgi:hypothetical protein
MSARPPVEWLMAPDARARPSYEARAAPAGRLQGVGPDTRAPVRPWPEENHGTSRALCEDWGSGATPTSDSPAFVPRLRAADDLSSTLTPAAA